MNEIKQLLMNGVFKKILLFILFMTSSAALVFFNHDKWIEYKSWVYLFFLVAFLQIISIGIIKLARSISWKEMYQRTCVLLFKKMDEDLKEEIKLMKVDFRQLMYFLNGSKKHNYLSLFFGNKIKLPFYILFESDSGIAENFIKKNNYHELSIKGSSNKVKILLSEKAVFCIISPDLLLKDKENTWFYFLKIVKRQLKKFSSVSTLIFVKNKDDISSDLGEWLQVCRCKIEDMTHVFNRFVPSYGISYQFITVPDIEEFIQGDKVWSKNILKLNISELSLDKRKKCLKDFFQTIFRKWTLYRYFSIEKLSKVSDKWKTFVFPDKHLSFFEKISSEWGRFIQDTPFYKPTTMHSLYFLESSCSEKMIWQDVLINTVNLEEMRSMNSAVYFSNIKKVNVGILITGFIIFLAYNISQINQVSGFYSYCSKLPKSKPISLLAQQYGRYSMLESQSFVFLGVFSLPRYERWNRLRNDLFKDIQENLYQFSINIEKKLIDQERNLSESGYISLTDGHNGNASIYENLKIFLTLVNKSPETVEDQISLLTDWMKDKKFINEKEIPEVKKVMADYFNKNNRSWIVDYRIIQSPVIQKVQNTLNSMSPVKSFLIQLDIIEKQLRWDAIDKKEIFSVRGMDLVKVQYLMPKLYTLEGWKQMVEPLIQAFINDAQRDDWVLGYQEKQKKDNLNGLSSSLIKKNLEEAYFKEYEKHWEKFFRDVSLKYFLNTNDASVKLGVFLHEEGPWKHFFNFVIKNIQPLLDARDNNLQVLRNFLKVSVSDEKNKIHDNYEGYLENLSNIQSELEGLLIHSEQGQAVEQYLRGLFITAQNNKNALSKTSAKLLKLQSMGYAQIEKNFYRALLDPLLKVFFVISKDGLLNIEKDWRLEVVNPFNTDLSEKFPFKNSPQEVALADFSHFFNPKKGKVVQFIETRLLSFIQDSKGRMVPKRWMGEPMPISSRFFSNIESAKVFSQGLFDQKSGEIGIRLQLLPEPSPYFSEFSIDVNGSSHVYKNDPEEWKLLDWPGESAYPKSTFSATAISPSFKFFESLSGEWSFFRLLKQYGEWKKMSQGNYLVSFKFRTDKKEDLDSNIVFRLKTDSKIDFFKMIEMNHFEIVDKIYEK
jgi:hypothetical protein